MRECADNRITRRQFLLASALAGGGVILPVSATAQNSMQMPSPATRPPVQTGPANEAKEKTKGYEVGYDLFSINGKLLGHGEAIKVKQGERVLFHVLNASAGEIRSLALPGHRFHVVSLDGNPVPNPADVPVLWIGTAERISAIVETIEMLIVKHNAALRGFNEWTLNGQAFSMETMTPKLTVHEGKRYRFKFRNASDDVHPLHLHRHSFELVRVGGKPTAGVMKDVVMLGGFQEVEFDFVADNPGLTLFHCHQQLHMDFGFMQLIEYA